MNYVISNQYLTVKVSSKGGELQSIRSSQGLEYLWQGDAAFWSGRAPVLFPYIGRLTEESYKLDGKLHHMKIHGFLKLMELEVVESSKQSVTFLLKSNEQTYEIYPREFAFLLQYRLEDSSIAISYRVISQDDRTMYFGAGGHPGFRVPLEEGIDFSDYYLEFGTPGTPEAVGISPACYIEGPNTPYPLKNDRILPLKHTLFDNDAIILQKMSTSVTLKSTAGKHGVTVSYPQMSYLGLWHRPKTEAPYVCIEPWSSLPSRQGVVEELETQPGLIQLPSKGIYTNLWSIAIF